uniref:Helicase-associated domain-containing protein n=2 Tax=Craspedostauros australis TaxID=1486917 RepID=A0A7R9WS27_9STRA
MDPVPIHPDCIQIVSHVSVRDTFSRPEWSAEIVEVLSSLVDCTSDIPDSKNYGTLSQSCTAVSTTNDPATQVCQHVPQTPSSMSSQLQLQTHPVQQFPATSMTLALKSQEFLSTKLTSSTLPLWDFTSPDAGADFGASSHFDALSIVSKEDTEPNAELFSESTKPIDVTSDVDKMKEWHDAHEGGSWVSRFQELRHFSAKHGHCVLDVKKHPGLSQWSKRQRYQYKLRVMGKHSTLTNDRLLALSSIGFVWESHKTIWEKRYSELAEFQKVHGHCNVPTMYANNPPLGVWLKGQRRQYHLLRKGRSSAITPERICRLNALGLQWTLRHRRPKKAGEHAIEMTSR